MKSFPFKVGGGLASGMTVQSALVKECLEEAAIPEELVRQARPAGTVRYNCLALGTCFMLSSFRHFWISETSS